MSKRKTLVGFNTVFCDASFFIALFSRKDTHHHRARELFEEVYLSKIRLVTTWLMISETLTILRYHYGFREASAFTQSLGLLSIIMPSEAQCQQAIGIFNVKSKDCKLSFADALSYVFLTGPLHNTPALSFDEDFQRLGLIAIR